MIYEFREVRERAYGQIILPRTGNIFPDFLTYSIQIRQNAQIRPEFAYLIVIPIGDFILIPCIFYLESRQE